jgi:hypothetical protein
VSITQPTNTLLRFRTADAGDAEQIAVLHTDSWRRHYRGAYADSFLDGDITTDRRTVWSSRLAAPAGTVTILAELADRPVGFIHVVFDHDPSPGGDPTRLNGTPRKLRMTWSDVSQLSRPDTGARPASGRRGSDV